MKENPFGNVAADLISQMNSAEQKRSRLFASRRNEVARHQPLFTVIGEILHQYTEAMDTPFGGLVLENSQADTIETAQHMDHSVFYDSFVLSTAATDSRKAAQLLRVTTSLSHPYDYDAKEYIEDKLRPRVEFHFDGGPGGEEEIVKGCKNPVYVSCQLGGWGLYTDVYFNPDIERLDEAGADMVHILTKITGPLTKQAEKIYKVASERHSN